MAAELAPWWPLLSAIGAAAGAYAAVKTELRWLRRDVDAAHRRIDRLEGRRSRDPVTD